MKCAAEGLQSLLTVQFAASRRERAAARGVRAERRDRGIAEQVALAHRESPPRGGHVALARAVVQDMPATMADRQGVDRELAGEAARLEAMGDRECVVATQQAAYRIDPEVPPAGDQGPAPPDIDTPS